MHLHILLLPAVAALGQYGASSTDLNPIISETGIVESTSTIGPSSYPSTNPLTDDSSGQPSPEDIAWADAFMAGKQVDSNLDFNANDITDDEDDGDDEDVDSSGENLDTFITALTLRRTHRSFIRARWRARFGALGELPTGPPNEDDIAWVVTFLSGGDNDENMIFDPEDLEEPLLDEDDGINDTTTSTSFPTISSIKNATTSAVFIASVPAALDSDKAALGKRHRSNRMHSKHKMAALHRAKRAIRRARARRRIKHIIEHVFPGPWSGHHHKHEHDNKYGNKHHGHFFRHRNPHHQHHRHHQQSHQQQKQHQHHQNHHQNQQKQQHQPDQHHQKVHPGHGHNKHHLKLPEMPIPIPVNPEHAQHHGEHHQDKHKENNKHGRKGHHKHEQKEHKNHGNHKHGHKKHHNEPTTIKIKPILAITIPAPKGHVTYVPQPWALPSDGHVSVYSTIPW